MDMSRKLYRSKTDRMLCGVCGGIGQYFSVDATIVRLVWVLASLCGPGLLAYIAAAVIIPTAPELP